MLESLRLKNFQSHRDTFLEFVDGVNVIFGISLSGKTSTTRGLNLLLNNRPLKAKFYSNFAPEKGKTEIEVVFKGGEKASIEKFVHKDKDRAKNLDKTVFHLGTEEYSETNKEVPEQIVQLFNMTELNIQKQFDQPFLITGSGGEFARTVNRVTKLDKPDEWVSELTKRINDTNKETKLLETQAKEIEIELAKYEGYEELEKQNQELANLSSELQVSINRENKLDTGLLKVEDIDAQLKQLKPAIDIELDISILTDLEESVLRLKRRLELVSMLVKANTLIDDLQRLFDTSKTVLEGLELQEDHIALSLVLTNIESKDSVIKSLKDLLVNMEKSKAYLEIEDDYAFLDGSIKNIELCDKAIKEQHKNHEDLKRQYIMLLREDKKCPICFSDIDNEIIERVESSL